MSIVGDGRDNDRENENQLAVWVRNVPTWLNEDRFYNEIQCWEDADVDKSHCFKNKQDNTWVGVRYGWAIVTFKNKQARNIFLENEEAHYVREAEGKPFEKLKVTPWYDNKSAKGNKAGNNNLIKIEKNHNKIPLYKSELEYDISNPLAEEFGRNCTENSIQAYRGKVHSYCTNLAGQGHVGLLEVKVRKSQPTAVVVSELVVFHSDSVWMCFKHRNCNGTIDCAVKCGTDNFLPTRLRLGTEVSFTARKIPAGVVEGKRYQAKAIWFGSDTSPNYISPPPAQKLDEYLEDYIKESGGGSPPNSKETSPFSECSNPKFQEISTSSSNSGTSSPLPGGYPTSKTNRPKPLKGGLNQLNSSQDNKKTVTVVKKSTPTNFAQAVAAAPTLIREEHSNLLLAVGYVDSLLSEVEALILVPEHGSFNLHIQQLDLGFKPSQAISKYLSPNLTTLSITLKQSKSLPGSKTKYEIVRAHLNEDKANNKYDDNFDPFSNEFKQRKKNDELPSADNWEELAESKPKDEKNGDEQIEFDPIDLDELDEYYDDLQKIIDYLEKELPKVIPTVANDEKCFNSLAHGILSNPRTPQEESKELETFLNKYSVSTRIKNIFITEYIKFREPAKNVVYSNGLDEHKNEETIGENNEIPEQKGESMKKSPSDIERMENTEQFYSWLNNAVRNKEIRLKKINLYTELLENNSVVADAWVKVVKNKLSSNFISFLNKATLGDEEMSKLRNWLVSTSTTTDFATFITWLEGDTNLFRLETSDVKDDENDNVSIDSSMHLFKNIDLSKLEKAFVEHQDGIKETSVFIFRVVMFLKKCEINLEGLKKLHTRHLNESSKPRNKEFNLKIHNLLIKLSTQKLLDDTNSKIKKQCELKEHTPNISYRRLDKFIPVVASSLCGFFHDKNLMDQSKDYRKEIVKDSKREIVSKERRHFDSKDDAENMTDQLPVTKEDSVDVVVEGPRKRRHENASSQADNFCDSDFNQMIEFLKLSTDSGRINLPPMTTPETLIWTFRAANVSHSKLEDMYKQCKEQGGFGWPLQVSQLKLNPPLGVTVPDIVEYLSAYFGSIRETDGEDVVVEIDDVCNDEDELLNMIQDNLYDQYKDTEITDLRKNIQKSNIKVREADLVSSYKELFASHYLFSNTNWPLDEDQFDFTSLCSLLTLGTWQNLNVTSDFLSMCVRNIQENDVPYQTVLVKWAKMLESSTIFNSSIMDIFTIIKATMMNFDENVMDDDLLNITTTYCLYNTEGIVSGHLSPSFYTVQTRHSLIICHLGITYCRCRQEDGSFPLPLDHWVDKKCSMSTCLPLGTRVLLHSTGIKDNSQGSKLICQIADIVWEMDEDKFDPPETGIILPGTPRYKKWVQGYAEKIVAENRPEIFSNNSFVFNQGKYNALEDQFPVEEEFQLSEIWPGHSTMEMRKMFVFSEMGGMARPLLRSNWAAMLNTSDQEKERLVDQTFTYFESDEATNEMIEFIKPYVEKDGLRNAMKVLNQKYPGKSDEIVEGEHLNDTDSEKRQQSMVDETEEDENSQDLVETETPTASGVRNRQLSTDTIKDETLWMAENNLEQLWADNDRILAEEDEDIVEPEEDSDISPNDHDNDASFEEEGLEDKHLGVIGRPKIGSRERSVNTDETSFDHEKKPTEDNGFISFEDQDKSKRFEAAVVNMSSWQPVASDLITSNRELIVALNSRVEYLEEVNSKLETSLQALSLRLASEEKVETKKSNDVKTGSGRCYVKIVKEGNEDDIAEVPTNSDGKLPLQTVKALFDGTSAIKYRVSIDSRTRRALLLEDELFHPPEDGWGDKIYMCTQPQGCVAAPKPNTSSAHPPVTGPSLLAPHTDHLGLSSYYSQTSPYHMAHIWGGGGGLGTSLSQVSPLPHAGFLVPGIGSNSLNGLGTNSVARSGLNKPPQPR